MKLVIDIPSVTYEEVKWRGLYLCPRDADALVNSIKNGTPYGERPKGEWIPIKNRNGTVVALRCSACGQSPKYAIKSDFCPRCGASMSANCRQVTGKLDENTQKHYGFRKKY